MLVDHDRSRGGAEIAVDHDAAEVEAAVFGDITLHDGGEPLAAGELVE